MGEMIDPKLVDDYIELGKVKFSYERIIPRWRIYFGFLFAFEIHLVIGEEIMDIWLVLLVGARHTMGYLFNQNEK